MADITYIRLREEFVFLAVILDAFSRRVIGWALDRTMEDELTLTALRMALARRSVQPGLVHHSDRGSAVCQQRLHGSAQGQRHRHQHERKGNPWDNAACESFMKTLKYEEVLRNEYRDLAEAQRLDPRVPGKGLQPETPALGARLSAAGRVRGPTGKLKIWRPLRGSLLHEFSRHREIYRSDVEMKSRERHLSTAPGAHRRR